jgi:hypothetical protein
VLARCVLDAENQNHQRMTSYEPFALGLKFGAWLTLDIWAYPKPGSKLAPNQQAQQVAAVMFMSFRDYQRRLGITDDQLIAAAAEGSNLNAVKARLVFWARQPPPF